MVRVIRLLKSSQMSWGYMICQEIMQRYAIKKIMGLMEISLAAPGNSLKRNASVIVQSQAHRVRKKYRVLYIRNLMR